MRSGCGSAVIRMSAEYDSQVFGSRELCWSGWTGGEVRMILIGAEYERLKCKGGLSARFSYQRCLVCFDANSRPRMVDVCLVEQHRTERWRDSVHQQANLAKRRSSPHQASAPASVPPSPNQRATKPENRGGRNGAADRQCSETRIDSRKRGGSNRRPGKRDRNRRKMGHLG